MKTHEEIKKTCNNLDGDGTTDCATMGHLPMNIQIGVLEGGGTPGKSFESKEESTKRIGSEDLLIINESLHQSQTPSKVQSNYYWRSMAGVVQYPSSSQGSGAFHQTLSIASSPDSYRIHPGRLTWTLKTTG